MVCTVIFMSNPTVVLCCVGVGVLTTLLDLDLTVSVWVGVRVGVCVLDEINAITAQLGWDWLAWAELGKRAVDITLNCAVCA